MEHKGDLEDRSPLEVFAYLGTRRTYGVIYFKDPEGLSTFVTVKAGVPFHCGGTYGEGDEALIKVLSLERGTYNYVEEIKTDEVTFPKNVSAELAAQLASGTLTSPTEVAGAAERAAETQIRDVKKTLVPASVAPTILPAGEPPEGLPSSTDDLVDAFLEAASVELTGLVSASKDGNQVGLFVFQEGVRVAGFIAGPSGFVTGDEAVERVPGGCEVKRYTLTEDLADLYARAARGATMVARTAAAAINPEEFIAWAVRNEVSCIIATSGSAGSANIVISDGRIEGAVTTRHAAFNPEIDDALAMFYAPDSEVEIYG